MQITKNFNIKEFDCNDGTKVPAIYLQNVKELAKRLEIIRRKLKNTPIKITSGYRTKMWNVLSGGVNNSQHLEAKAVDFKSTFSPEEVYTLIIQLTDEGKLPNNGCVIQYRTFVHYDIRENNNLIKIKK